jgi:hypothetical protein
MDFTLSNNKETEQLIATPQQLLFTLLVGLIQRF